MIMKEETVAAKKNQLSQPSPGLRSVRLVVWAVLLFVVSTQAIAFLICVAVRFCYDSHEDNSTCMHAFYAESNGQCMVPVLLGDDEAADDYSRSVLCHDASIALALARKYTYSPFFPHVTAPSIHPSCCGGNLETNEGENYVDDSSHPNPFLFSHVVSKKKRKRKGRSTKINVSHHDDDVVILKRVVSRHRRNSENNIDREHPLKRIVESAAALFGRSKSKQIEQRQKMWEDSSSGAQRQKSETREWASDASTSTTLNLSQSQKKLVAMVTRKVREGGAEESVTSLSDRFAQVGWGGPITAGGKPWWLPSSSTKSEEEGTRLAAAYLKIMDWPTTEYKTKFPFSKCSNGGCSPDFAFVHTLEWREKFKPFCMTPSATNEGKDGFFYTRGHSPSSGDAVGHSLVFYRPGLHNKYESEEAYLRLILHTLDAAVANCLTRSNDMVGKFNIILDCDAFSLSQLPSFSEIKRLFTYLQDHFPDRLGVLMIANLSGAAQLFLKMIKSIISEAVRKKIHIIPKGEKGKEMLQILIEEEYIPTWLGGTDDFIFDPNLAYENRMCSEAEGREYLKAILSHDS